MRRDRHRLVHLGWLLLGVALVTSACEPAGDLESAGLTGGWATAGCALSRTPQAVTVGGTTMLVTPPALAAAMARIEAGGRADFAASYAGLEVDQQRVQAIVYRVPSVEFDDFVRHAAEDACVIVRDAAFGLADLTAWQERIVADLDRWRARGLPVTSVGARHDGAGVEIGTADVARARREMLSEYGERAPLVFVEQGPAVPLPSRPGGPPTVPQPGG